MPRRRVGLPGRQALEDRVEVRPARAVAGVDPVGAEEPELEPGGEAGGGDRGRGRHGRLERGLGVDCGP